MIGKPEFIINEKISWFGFSENPNAIHILEQNMDKIDWYNLTQNPNAIDILEKNVDKIDWKLLSKNPNAIQLLETNIDKVYWNWFSQNPNAIHLLFKYDYELIKQNNHILEELVSYIMNPNRISRLSSQYGITFDELLEYY